MLLFAAALLTMQAQTSSADSAPLVISIVHGSEAEKRTKSQLDRLLAATDVSLWRFTSKVQIDESAIPTSHPVLTLHTRHAKDDDLLLSTYVHEQLHWFVSQRDTATAGAVRDLRKLFPTIPVGYPEGSSDERVNYVHLIIIYLEDQANRLLLGELRAKQVHAFWADDHYTWLYRTVAARNQEVGAVLRAHGLLYPVRRPRR